MAKNRTIKNDEVIKKPIVKEEQKEQTKEKTKTEVVKGEVLTKAEIMKRALAKQPKVNIFLPLEPKENENATETVTLNGYRVNIKKGVYVDVPRQIAEILMDAQKQTRKAFTDAMEKIRNTEKPVFDNK